MKIFTKFTNYHKAIFIVTLLISALAQAQLKNSFDPRFNEAVNGDFTIIANNMVSTTATGDYNGTNDNNEFSNMVYVDIDNDNTTFNSSSANFVNPAPTMSCLNIKKALLYWAASDQEPDPNDPASENQPNWNYNDIKLMLPSETVYTTYTADEVIYRGREDHVGPPNDGHFSNDPYICVKDITNDVIDLIDNSVSPYGTYQVANVEGKIGSLNDHDTNIPTGVSGGWQIVFVYESPLLPLKNISIFDGYGHVVDGQGSYNIDFNGFQTVPTGDVNANILMGALEGDLGLNGDRLQIENVSNTFVDLTTSPTSPIRTGNNFFNSKITIDNANFTDRIPASTNTLGFDAAIFQLSNPSNTVIGNNQTSATFRLTSTQETYGLFLLGFSVDVWSPNLGPIHLTLDTPDTSLNPSTTFGASFTVENTGNDDAKSLEISTTLPPQVTLVEPITPALPTGITYNYNTGTNLLEFFVADGVADAGAPAVNVDFDLQVRDECYFLETSCDLQFDLQLEATYSGNQNPTPQSTVSSANVDDCGVGILDPIIIDVTQPTISWDTADSALDREVECNDAAALNAAQSLEPDTNKCNLTLTKTSGVFVPNPTCPSLGTYTNIWNFTDACGTTIADYVQTITIVNTTPLVIPVDGASTVACIANATETFILPAVNDACGNVLSPAPAVITENPDPLTCEGTRTYTYTYEDCAGNTDTWAFVYTIDTPAFTIPDADGASTVACIGDADGSSIVLPTVTDACNNTLTASVPVITDSPNPLTCEGTRTYTYTYEDCAGNTDTWAFVYTIDLSPFTLPANGIETVDNLADAVEPTPPVVTDNCSNTLTPSGPTVSTTPNCQGSIVYTFTYNDCAGNTADWTYTYTIQLAPFTVPANDDSTVNCITDVTTPTPPVVNDANGDNITPVMIEGADPVCEGDKVYTFTYTDCAGNTADWIYTYTIDIPAFTIADADGTSTVACIANATETFTLPTVNDACGNVLLPAPAVITENPDPLTCEGTRTYTYTYEDCAGNTDTWAFVYTIDTPAFTIPDADGASTVACIGDADGSGIVLPTVTDACNNTLTASVPVITENPDPLTCEGTRTYTYTYEDCAGNTDTWAFVYTIDLSPFTLPANGIETVDNLADAVEPTPPIVTDNCSNTLTPSVPTVSTTPNCQGSIVYTFTYNDCAGNTADWTYTYTIQLAPFTVPANDGSTVNCITDVTTPTPPVVNDANGDNITPVMIEGADPVCEGDKIYTFTYTDCAGNTADWIYTYTIDIPAFTIADTDGTSTVACIANATETFTLPTVNDACGNVLLPAPAVITENPDPLTCEGTRTYTYTYEDCAGNTDTWAFVYTIDTPAFTIPDADGASTVACIGDADGSGIVLPTVTDACNNTLTASVPVITENPDPLTCEGTRTYTYTYEDCAGNTDTWAFVYTIDLSPFTLPANGIETVDNLADAVEPTPPVVTDNCSNTLTPSGPTVSTTPNCQGSIVYTFTYNDCAGNTADWTYTYTIQLAPFTVPANDGSTVNCIADATTPTPPVVNDANGNNITPVMIEGSDPICEGDKIYTFTYTDCAGNTADWIYTYTIDIPAFTIPDADGASTVECIDNATETFTLPSVNDACGNILSPAAAVITETSGSVICEVIRTYTYTYEDCAGNTDTWAFIYTVKDTTPPVLTLPVNQTAECSDDLSPIIFGEATATDNCDANPVITFEDVRVDGNCSGTFKIIRTWKATDACGNVATANQEISTSDTTAPEFVQTTLPGDITVECDTIPDAETLTATDNCGDATVEFTQVRVDGNCLNNYTITRTWVATDECGLTNTHIQTIIVQDTTPPVFEQTTLPELTLVVECDNIPDAETLTATDSCGSATVTVNDVRTDGDCPNSYRIARTWTATDECNLTTTHTQIITVQDTTPPTFEGILPNTSAIVECDAIPDAETLTATDNCGDAIVTVEDVRTNGDCPNNYIIARTWTATDACDLTTTFTQIITVQDTTAPVPTTTFEDTLNVSCTDIPEAPELTFTDNCSTNIIVVFNETNTYEENVFADYQIVRTWTVRDECNNEEVYTQTLQVALDEIITDVVAPDWCYDEGMIDMNNLLEEGLNTNGNWELLEGDPAATLSGNIFDPTGLELSLDFLPESGGIDYTFRYTTTHEGCISITEITMNVHADCVVLPCGENDITISKAVTPNGDAYNEFFEITGIELCGFQFEVQIFNRWGALIYESDNYQNDWNGIASSASVGTAGKVPNGTYYYIIKLLNSGLDPITGPVYLGTK